MIFVVVLLGVASASEIGSTKYLSRVIDTGDGTTLKVESYGMPFEVEQPGEGRVNVKFGDSEAEGRESIAFRHGAAYVWVLNDGGATMERSSDGSQFTLTIRQCDCAQAPQQMQVSPSVIRQEVPLDDDHSFKIESTVRFEVFRRPDCVDLVIGKPSRNGIQMVQNHIYRYASYKLNITNYSPENVRLTMDNRSAKCSIGNIPTTTTSTTTTTTTTTTTKKTTTTTTTTTRSTQNYEYQGTVNLDQGYSIRLESSVQFVVQRPSRWNVQLIIGQEHSGGGVAHGTHTFGQYNVEVINYSRERVNMDTSGRNAMCRVGEPKPTVSQIIVIPTAVQPAHYGVRSRTLDLEGDLSLEVTGSGDWELSRDGYRLQITIGSDSGRNDVIRTRSHSEFQFGSYAIIVENHSSQYFVLEQINNRLRCFIGMDPQ